MIRAEYEYSYPEGVGDKLLNVSNSIKTFLKDNTCNYRVAKFLDNTAGFLKIISQKEGFMEYLPQIDIKTAQVILSPWIRLETIPNPDIDFAWSKAIAKDYAFRWEKLHKWKRRFFRTQL